MTKILTISNQKGGTGKSTSTGAVAYVLAEDYGFKTLVIDFDPQGNQTEMLTGCDTEEFEERTILEAMEDLDARPYVLQVTENLHLIPADDNLGMFPRFACSRFYEKDRNGNVLFDEMGYIKIGKEAGQIMKRTLDTVRADYDVILIDTPPMLSDFTVNALNASNGCVVMYQTHPFCYSAVRRFLESVKDCKERSNPDLKLYGILAAMIDTRRSDANAYLEAIYEKYSDLVFKTTIKYQAAVGRLPVYGLDPQENKELNAALEQFREFTKELLVRIKEDRHFEVTEELVARDE